MYVCVRDREIARERVCVSDRDRDRETENIIIIITFVNMIIYLCDSSRQNRVDASGNIEPEMKMKMQIKF